MNRERGSFSTRRFLIGKAGPFPRLVFREEVMGQIDQFARTRPNGEHGGFLIGRKRNLKSLEEYEILVERFVPIPQRDEASRLVISAEHWDTVSQALEKAGGNEKIVGWVHTHPGFGVFLSSFDKDQHERFFPEPWQVAYVIDTHSQNRAAYHMVNHEWHQLEGYYILRQLAEDEIGVTGLSDYSSIRWSRVAVLLVILALLISGGVYGYHWVKEAVFQPYAAEVPLDDVEEVPPVVVSPSVTAPAQPPSSTITQPEPPVIYGEYVVKKGESLWTIAYKLWGDSNLYYALAEANNISEPSKIREGMILRVPPKPKE